MKNVKQEIREMLAGILEVDDLGIADDDDFLKSDLEMDSIAILELELKLKKRYGIKAENLPREVFTSISSIAHFLDEEISCKSKSGTGKNKEKEKA